ncbi:low molecular weight protein-tyrosine-phosphatase [Hufsiella ginkgonis]|uniref:protein-tyrosine-phosphatase n=1 Tax=Hufsiella ginkgonis TaxID=2695274 RepID=A0A7K1XUC4_9SPHI|nr:low molecular weight protein-tyrosine-phosphatase [Hufsiella ginkgonis]MXV14611.1 low molecular weight phosphotyrosine protein phosphatase [Hufsiella ginkgonis]
MKILMVCLGNICRSPLAHGIMEHEVKKAGLDWDVDSAGTGNWHVGEPPDRRSIAVAKNYGIDISSQCCRVFNVKDFDEYDRIYVMDRSNLADVLRLARNDGDRQKVQLLLKNDIVPDPYYDNALFDPVFVMIEKACKRIIADFSGDPSRSGTR